MTSGRVLILGGGHAGTCATRSAKSDLVNRPRLYETGPGPHLRYPRAAALDPVGSSSRE